MKLPKITIVTPNFNGATHLEETILSVVSQGYPNLEYIIVDGGSTDESLKIIQKHERQISRWISEPDAGMYHALQKGFSMSSGEIMGWINSDDMYHPRSFFGLAEIFMNFSEIKWLTGAQTLFDQSGRTVAVGQPKQWKRLDFYSGNYQWIQQESTFWRKSLWEVTGARFNTELKYAADFDLWLRFFEKEELYTTSALLGGFRVGNPDQLSVRFFDSYMTEVALCLKAVTFSEVDLAILRKLHLAKKLARILKFFRFFRTDLVESLLYPDKAKSQSRIEFDRDLGKFRRF